MSCQLISMKLNDNKQATNHQKNRMTYEFENPSFWIELRSPVDKRFDDPIAKLQNQSRNTILRERTHRNANSVHPKSTSWSTPHPPAFPIFFDASASIRRRLTKELPMPFKLVPSVVIQKLVGPHRSNPGKALDRRS